MSLTFMPNISETMEAHRHARRKFSSWCRLSPTIPSREYAYRETASIGVVSFFLFGQCGLLIQLWRQTGMLRPVIIGNLHALGFMNYSQAAMPAYNHSSSAINRSSDSLVSKPDTLRGKFSRLHSAWRESCSLSFITCCRKSAWWNGHSHEAWFYVISLFAWVPAEAWVRGQWLSIVVTISRFTIKSTQASTA